MSTTQVRMVSAGLFFLVIFLFGFWLSRSGKPYNQAVFTIHKLIALAAIVFLVTIIYKMHQAAPLGPAQMTAIGITALCFAATILTGGLLSIDKAMPAIVLRVHQITPYLTVLSTAATLYLLLVISSKMSTT
jgi:hypothetical protein